ncbi:RusA family crossover junction endodeoxyribonuclease [Photobacterium halotolerans]|uniref:RusA family crossover junction endodeoxyribonuclease n=3 Tax=Photobacterium halotolerans TaxID=265726 RepID=A0A7X5AT21_9GAMM|nr:RusA family crossover junction endodeoxyribonuclease [Photobacterium halotolerans]
MMCDFSEVSFKNGNINFKANVTPVSLQNRGDRKAAFKRELQEITRTSPFVVTGTCWISIDYYCQHVKRIKNPGAYDIDNIIKPILDSLVGQAGLILDDVLVDRVTVNWIDTPHEDHIEIQVEYPDLLFCGKDDLVLIKHRSGWCFPIHRQIAQSDKGMELIQQYFDIWNSIDDEHAFNASVWMLPIQNFVYFTKVRESGFEIIELKCS